MALCLSLWMHTPTCAHCIRGPDYASTRRTAPKLHLLGPLSTHPHTSHRKHEHPANQRTLATPTDA
eukprot:6981619-Prorocentrum_lima.AAC.1